MLTHASLQQTYVIAADSLSAPDHSLLLVCPQDALGDTENGDSVSVNFFGDGTANNGAPARAVCSLLHQNTLWTALAAVTAPGQAASMHLPAEDSSAC